MTRVVNVIGVTILLESVRKERYVSISW